MENWEPFPYVRKHGSPKPCRKSFVTLFWTRVRLPSFPPKIIKFIQIKNQKGKNMNVFYKIVELAQEAPVMETNTNNSMFLIGAIVVAFLAFAFLGSVTKATEKGVSSGFLIMPLIVILFFMVSNFAVKPVLYKTATTEIKKTEKENEKTILELYHSNLQLFDNKKMDNVQEIIKIAAEKKEKFDGEVNKITNEISNKLQEEKLYLEQEKIKPFAELYVMDKEKIPVTEKVQQKISPEDAGKICKAIKVKECFNNSSFDEYNKEKREREEKLAKLKKPDSAVNTLINATAIGGVMYLILK